MKSENLSIGEAQKSPIKWRDEEDSIRLTISPDGTRGPAWIERLQRRSFLVSDVARNALSSVKTPVVSIETEIVILRSFIWEDHERTVENIRAEASRRRLARPAFNIACHIRENFSDVEMQAMGFERIITMHDPILCPDDFMYLLMSNRRDKGNWFRAYREEADHTFDGRNGFAFAVQRHLH